MITFFQNTDMSNRTKRELIDTSESLIRNTLTQITLQVLNAEKRLNQSLKTMAW